MSISDGEHAPRHRRRRTPDEARLEALASARRLLLDRGPERVTLKAVADDLGMSHGNLIHHFGSAEALQSALMTAMVRDLAEALERAVVQARSDKGAPRAVVDIVFDAFDQGGAGQLAAWIGLSRDPAHLDPVREAVGDLILAVREKVTAEGEEAPRHIASALLMITLCAFGDAVIGSTLRDVLGRDREAVRRIAARLLPSFF